MMRFIKAIAGWAVNACVSLLPARLTIATVSYTVVSVTAGAVATWKILSLVVNKLKDTAMGRYTAMQWYKHHEIPGLVVLSNDLSPFVKTICVIIPFAIVSGVLFFLIYRQRQDRQADQADELQQGPAARPIVDLESQRAAAAQDIVDTEQHRMVRQALGEVNLDNGAGPSTKMIVGPLHQTPDNSPIAPPLPPPMTRPAARSRPFGFTLLDMSGFESA